MCVTTSPQPASPGLMYAHYLDCLTDDTICPLLCAQSDNIQKLLFPQTVVSSAFTPEDHRR